MKTKLSSVRFLEELKALLLKYNACIEFSMDDSHFIGGPDPCIEIVQDHRVILQLTNWELIPEYIDIKKPV